MSVDACTCGRPNEHAKAVEPSIFACLQNATVVGSDENKWRATADKLERKFTTDHGKHYSYFTQPKELTNDQ